MNKPAATIIKIYNLGLITGMDIYYVQTGADSAETRCRITGTKGKAEGKWDTYSPYLDVAVRYNSIAKLTRSYINQVDSWVKFEAENKGDIDEYNRLKDKLGL